MPIDVLANLLVRRPAGRRAEVATSPEVASPVPPSQMLKLLLQQSRRPTFHLLHHHRWTERRWTRHQYVHVIFADVTALDLHLQRKTRLANQRPRSPCHFTPSVRDSDTWSPTRSGTEYRICCANRVGSQACRFWESSFSMQKLASHKIRAKAARLKDEGFGPALLK